MMDISHTHLQRIKDSLPDSIYQVYSSIYEKTFSFYGAKGASNITSNARAELASLAAIRHKFSRLVKA